MKKSIATTSFSKDFSIYKTKNEQIISGLLVDLSDSLDKELLEDFFNEQIDDLRSDMSAMDANEAEKHGETEQEIKDAKLLCNTWVNNNLINASDATLIALVLWMHGLREGKRKIEQAIAKELAK